MKIKPLLKIKEVFCFLKKFFFRRKNKKRFLILFNMQKEYKLRCCQMKIILIKILVA